MDRPEEVRTSQKSPIEATGPREAISSPTISVTSPIQGRISIDGTCSTSSPIAVVDGILSPQPVDQATFDLGQLSIHGSIQDTLRGFKKYFTGLQAGIHHQDQVLRRSGLLEIFADQVFERRVHADAADFAGLELLE